MCICRLYYYYYYCYYYYYYHCRRDLTPVER